MHDNKIQLVIHQYREIIRYLFFGVCTTVLNMVLYYLFYERMGVANSISVVISNLLCILFAYITNRKWVFQNKAEGAKAIKKEMTTFFLARVGTLVIDWAFMVVTVDYLLQNGSLMKLVANIIVVILNYLASKLLIFVKR